MRRLYGLADAEAGDGDPVGLGADLLGAGCRLVQLRCKAWSDDEVIRAARALADRCRACGATLIVNDRAELALAGGADGVHLGQLDGAVAEARRVLGSGAIVGRSTGDVDQIALAVQEADYVAFGPVYPTPHLSRPKAVRGIDGLRAARVHVPAGVPLVAIGGIDASSLAEVVDAGADAWAVIGAIARVTGEARAAAIRTLS